MHVLIISTEAYLPPESPLEGIFQHHQAQALLNNGLHIGILSPVVNSFLSYILGKSKFRYGIKKDFDNNIPVFRGDTWAFSLKNINSIKKKWISIGIKLFKNYIHHYGKPDLIHAHNTWYAGILANEIKNLYGINYVITEHSSSYAQNLIPDTAQNYILKAISNSSKLIVVSPSLGNILTNKFPDVINNLIYIPNVLDSIFEREGYSDTFKEDKENFTFLNIAALNANKNQEMLIIAFADKFKNIKNVSLKIGGDGLLWDKLIILAQELQIENQVFFLGRLSRKQVLEEMQKCNVFVLSSITETFGVVLIEALSCGKPLISTACGGPEVIINENNGVIVSNKNKSALAEGMVKMYSTINNYDSMLIRSQCIDNYGEKAFVRNVSKIYNEVIDFSKK